MHLAANGDRKLFQNGLLEFDSLYTFSLKGLEMFTIPPLWDFIVVLADFAFQAGDGGFIS
jgi:hypothetical protein